MPRDFSKHMQRYSWSPWGLLTYNVQRPVTRAQHWKNPPKLRFDIFSACHAEEVEPCGTQIRFLTENKKSLQSTHPLFSPAKWQIWPSNLRWTPHDFSGATSATTTPTLWTKLSRSKATWAALSGSCDRWWPFFPSHHLTSWYPRHAPPDPWARRLFAVLQPGVGLPSWFEVHIGSLCCTTSLKPPKSLIILLCESHSMESQYDSNSRNQVAAGASDFADELHKQLSQRHKPSCLGLSVGILSEMVLATERIGFRRKNIR